jgi:hypothetical protein
LGGWGEVEGGGRGIEVGRVVGEGGLVGEERGGCG